MSYQKAPSERPLFRHESFVLFIRFRPQTREKLDVEWDQRMLTRWKFEAWCSIIDLSSYVLEVPQVFARGSRCIIWFMSYGDGYFWFQLHEKERKIFIFYQWKTKANKKPFFFVPTNQKQLLLTLANKVSFFCSDSFNLEKNLQSGIKIQRMPTVNLIACE